MSGASLKVEIKAELERVRAMLQEQAALDYGSLTPRLGEYLLRSTRQRFVEQKGPDGQTWQALSRRTRKKYNQDKVLTLRGYLRRSVHYRIESDRVVAVGTNLRYAAAHQLGSSFVVNAHSRVQRYRSVAGRMLFAGKRHKRVVEKNVTTGGYMVNVPARPFLGISAEDRAQILRIIKDWLGDRGK